MVYNNKTVWYVFIHQKSLSFSQIFIWDFFLSQRIKANYRQTSKFLTRIYSKKLLKMCLNFESLKFSLHKIWCYTWRNWKSCNNYCCWINWWTLASMLSRYITSAWSYISWISTISWISVINLGTSWISSRVTCFTVAHVTRTVNRAHWN